MALQLGAALYRRVFDQVGSASASLTPTAAAATTTNVASTITVPGAAIGDLVDVLPPSSLLNLILQGEVTAANVVTLKFANVSAGSITAPAGIYTAIVYRPTTEVKS